MAQILGYPTHASYITEVHLVFTNSNQSRMNTLCSPSVLVLTSVDWFVFQMRMSGTAEAVSKFLTDLAAKLKALGDEDRELFLKMKEEEVRE